MASLGMEIERPDRVEGRIFWDGTFPEMGRDERSLNG
jgi:hypothetical protein